MYLNNETISAAQGLASFDWPVFPVNPDTKAPLITGWQNRATSDRSGVAELFKDYPLAAIGLVTGQKSGLVVIDIDERENFSGLQNFKDSGHKIPPTITASTPSGGIHLFFKAPPRCQTQFQVRDMSLERRLKASSINAEKYTLEIKFVDAGLGDVHTLEEWNNDIKHIT